MRVVILRCLAPGQEIIGSSVVFRSPSAEPREAKLVRLRIAQALAPPSPKKDRP